MTQKYIGAFYHALRCWVLTDTFFLQIAVAEEIEVEEDFLEIEMEVALPMEAEEAMEGDPPVIVVVVVTVVPDAVVVPT
jgi:hypothetical protein